jgi:hypothetical protein
MLLSLVDNFVAEEVEADDEIDRAPDASARAAAAPAVVAHHRRGEQHTKESRLRCQLGLQRFHANKVRQRLERLGRPLEPSFSARVAATTFGKKGHDAQKNCSLADGSFGSMAFAERLTQDKHNIDVHGVVSAVFGQAAGISNAIADDAASRVAHILDVNVFDDASM